MKKIYTKPEIYFESFSLSTNIANDCDAPFTLAAKDICAIPDANGVQGMGIFNMTVAGSNCGVHGEGNEMYNGFCYHIPTDSNMLFNS